MSKLLTRVLITAFALFVAFVGVSMSYGQSADRLQVSSGDTVYTSSGTMLWTSKAAARKVRRIQPMEPLVVQSEAGRMIKVIAGSSDGWVSKEAVEPRHMYLARKHNIDGDAQRILRELAWRDSLRKLGYTIVVDNQSIEQNSADGISVNLRISNISARKAVKYFSVEMSLYNSVGDRTSGQYHGSSQSLRAVGPIEPQEHSTYRFDNVWYSSSGACVVIDRIRVQHIDGSTFTYLQDLRDITGLSPSVRLQGDCSYEAQKRRR